LKVFCLCQDSTVGPSCLYPDGTVGPCCPCCPSLGIAVLPEVRLAGYAGHASRYAGPRATAKCAPGRQEHKNILWRLDGAAVRSERRRV
jgi:hypothetical protein